MAVKIILKKLFDWCKKNFIEVNLSKCGLMELRADRSTTQTVEGNIMGIPVVHKYKYLGVILDDCLDLREEIAIRMNKHIKLRKSEWLMWSGKLDG